MGRVLITRRLPDGGTDALSAHDLAGPKPDDSPYTAAELHDLAPSVDGIVCLLTDTIDASVLHAGCAGSLRIVANVAVGYNNIDVATAHECGVLVANTPGVLDETTADTAFFLILAAARLAHDAESDLRSGTWTGWGINQYLGVDVHGSILGLIGYGRIGRAVARRAQGFGMQVLHHTRHDTGKAGFVADLDELLDRCDIVSLHTPLTPETNHLIDARRLARLGPDGVLVNTSRGPVVDEAALAEALHDETIFAAGLDVYEHEPEIHPRLLTAPRTVLLPHIGSASLRTRLRMASMACEAVAAALRGETPPNLIPAF